MSASGFRDLAQSILPLNPANTYQSFLQRYSKQSALSPGSYIHHWELQPIRGVHLVPLPGPLPTLNLAPACSAQAQPGPACPQSQLPTVGIVAWPCPACFHSCLSCEPISEIAQPNVVHILFWFLYVPVGVGHDPVQPSSTTEIPNRGAALPCLADPQLQLSSSPVGAAALGEIPKFPTRTAPRPGSRLCWQVPGFCLA